MAGYNLDAQDPREVMMTIIYFICTWSEAHPGKSEHGEGTILSERLLTCCTHLRSQDLHWWFT